MGLPLGLILAILVLLGGVAFWLYRQGGLAARADQKMKDAEEKDAIAEAKSKYADKQAKINEDLQEEHARIDDLDADALTDELNRVRDDGGYKGQDAFTA